MQLKKMKNILNICIFSLWILNFSLRKQPKCIFCQAVEKKVIEPETISCQKLNQIKPLNCNFYLFFNRIYTYILHTKINLQNVVLGNSHLCSQRSAYSVIDCIGRRESWISPFSAINYSAWIKRGSGRSLRANKAIRDQQLSTNKTTALPARFPR